MTATPVCATITVTAAAPMTTGERIGCNGRTADDQSGG
jgi:hypothetical protein